MLPRPIAYDETNCLQQALEQLMPGSADPLLRRFATYWLKIRGQNLVPQYRDIDPIGMPWALADIFVVERRDDGMFAYRLAGENMNARLGPHLKGKTAFQIFEKSYAQWTESRWQKAANELQACYTYTTHRTSGGRVVTAERVLFPTLRPSGEADILIGATSFQAPLIQPGLGPDDLENRRVQWTRLDRLPRLEAQDIY